MTEQLLSPRRATDICCMVMQIAARYVERGILFLVKEEMACGLAGFGLRPNDNESTASTES